jgi:hypothetical protein
MLKVGVPWVWEEPIFLPCRKIFPMTDRKYCSKLIVLQIEVSGNLGQESYT